MGLRMPPRVLALAAFGFILLVLLLWPPRAGAGTYDVYSCRLTDGTPAPTNGWARTPGAFPALGWRRTPVPPGVLLSRAPRRRSRFAVALSGGFFGLAALDAQGGGADDADQDEGEHDGDAEHRFLSVALVDLGASRPTGVGGGGDRVRVPAVG